ncbi:hypothetical protein IM538_14050 [Cytobacillus suaedae]|nr:hypothetical protein IM538_14050 [Cytobacillus suaedae]
MRNTYLYLSIFFILISSFGCQQKSEVNNENSQVHTELIEKITIYPMDSNFETLVIKDTKTIELVNKAVCSAEIQPGIANMSDPQFKIVIGEEAHFLWIDDSSGTIMNTEDTHMFYSLSASSFSVINEIFASSHLSIKEIAWNFLKEKGWNDRANDEWGKASVTKVLVNDDYELVDKSYEGKEVFSVSFEDKENTVVGTPIVLVDADTDRVIGYMPGD